MSRARKISDCQSTSIRLQNDGDFPFYVHEGMPNFFVQKEDSLLVKDNNQCAIHDKNGQKLLDCMCGNVIRSHFNASYPFFSKKGSFWTNSTTNLLLDITSDQRKFIGRTRNLCNLSGYESVALIPLISDKNIIGLIHLADPRENMFTAKKVIELELIADEFATIIKRADEISEKFFGIDKMTQTSDN